MSLFTTKIYLALNARLVTGLRHKQVDQVVEQWRDVTVELVLHKS